MADKKISALTAATTPLAGTEVLPIVQSGATVKVSVDNLTTGKDVTVKGLTATSTTDNNVTVRSTGTSNAASLILRSGNGTTSGLYAYARFINDNTAGQDWRLGIYGDSDVQLVNATGSKNLMRWTTGGDVNVVSGNLVVGTAGKGIDFSANGGDVLTQYDEGTWTPSIANSFNNYTHTIQVGRYTRIGNIVTLQFTIAWTTTNAGAFSFVIDGLPFTPVTLTNYASAGSIGVINNLTNTNQIVCQVESNSAQIKFYARVSGGAATALASSNWNTAGTANQVSGTITYQV